MAQAASYRTPRFLTFKQALEVGGNVRKGERGTKVYFVKQLQVRDQDADDSVSARLIAMMREYTVFNVDQCENLPDSINTRKPIRVRNPDTRDELADAFLHSTGADIREGHGEAYYVPSRNFISMPAFAGFKGADHFYNVVFHELTHWSGHKSRLYRDLKNRFGSRDYAAEESPPQFGLSVVLSRDGLSAQKITFAELGSSGAASAFRQVADFQYLQRSLANTTGKLAIAGTGIDFLVCLIRHASSVSVLLSSPELLSKFGETSPIRPSGLPDPLVAVERFGLSKKC
jgi:Zincin-like metallopeptidase/N-terminal domain of anti-restriction factor ArdC